MFCKELQYILIESLAYLVSLLAFIGNSVLIETKHGCFWPNLLFIFVLCFEKSNFFFCLQLYIKCGKTERSVGILEDYLKDHPSEVDLSMVDQLADILMSSNAHDKALQHIELAHTVYCSGKEVPLNLKIKAGLCHLQLGNKEHAEVCCIYRLRSIISYSFIQIKSSNCSCQ